MSSADGQTVAGPKTQATVESVRDRIRLRATTVQLGIVLGTFVQVSYILFALVAIDSSFTGSDSMLPTSQLTWTIICTWLGMGIILCVLQIGAPRRIRNTRGYRQPTQAEWELIAPAWAAVARRAGVRENDYGIVISNYIACVSSGRSLVLTRESVRSLTTQQLEAVIAHELGHALTISGMVQMAAAWFTLPGLLLLKLPGYWYDLARWIIRFTYRYTRLTLGFFLPRPVPFLGAMFLAGYWGVVPILIGALFCLWLIPLFVTAVLLAWLFRLCDRFADTVAADLGYGAVIADVLSRVTPPPNDDRTGWQERLFGWKLPASVRLLMLGRYMANQGI